MLMYRKGLSQVSNFNDLTSPLPMTKSSNQYVFSVMYFATIWPEGFALSEINSESICGASMSLFARFWFP